MRLRKLKELLNKQKGASGSECKADRIPTHREVHIENAVRVDLVPNILDELKSGQREDSAYKKKNLFWSRLSAILIFVYAGITLLVYSENKRSADIAEQTITQASKRFEIEQRPIVWSPNKVSSPVYLPKFKRIVWDWYYTNYGKTPARNVKLYEFFKIRNGNWQHPPTSSKQEYTFGAPLPPGKEDFKTMVTLDLAPDEASRILSEDAGISMKIRITYDDAFGNYYESQLCVIHLATGATQYCGPDEAYIDSPGTAP